jgi:hypothetical protein
MVLSIRNPKQENFTLKILETFLLLDHSCVDILWDLGTLKKQSNPPFPPFRKGGKISPPSGEGRREGI